MGREALEKVCDGLLIFFGFDLFLEDTKDPVSDAGHIVFARKDSEFRGSSDAIRAARKGADDLTPRTKQEKGFEVFIRARGTFDTGSDGKDGKRIPCDVADLGAFEVIHVGCKAFVDLILLLISDHKEAL